MLRVLPLVLCVLAVAPAAAHARDPYHAPLVVDSNPDPTIVETTIAAKPATVDGGRPPQRPAAQPARRDQRGPDRAHQRHQRRLPLGVAGQPGGVFPSAKRLPVRADQLVRLQVVNGATTRFMRLRLTDANGNECPLLRIGGEGGMLDQLRIEGGKAPGIGFGTGYGLGEIVLPPPAEPGLENRAAAVDEHDAGRRAVAARAVAAHGFLCPLLRSWHVHASSPIGALDRRDAA